MPISTRKIRLLGCTDLNLEASAAQSADAPRCVADVAGPCPLRHPLLRAVPDLHYRFVAQVLDGQCEGAMVTPLAIDVQVASTQALPLKAEFLHDPQAGGVLGSDIDLHPMEPQHQERVITGCCERKRHDPLACKGFGDPV